MKIAFLNRQRSAYPGGDLVMIDATIEALGKIGIEAIYAPEGWTIDWLKQFDLVHIFHCNFGWSRYNFDRTIESKVPYVVSPIFYPDPNLGMNFSEIREAFNHSQYVLPNSYVEWEEAYRLCGDIKVPIKAIPNGTATIFHSPNNGPFRSNDVICLSAREGDKNIDKIEAACKIAGLSFTLPKNYSRIEVSEALRASKVFVNASGSERMSLTTGEALCAGCRVIDTIYNRGNVWYGAALITEDPNIPAESWAATIQYAVNNPKWNYSPNAIARRLTWDFVAQELAKVYKACISR